MKHRDWQEAGGAAGIGTTTTVETPLSGTQEKAVTDNEIKLMMLENPKYAELFDENGRLDPDYEGDPLHQEFVANLQNRLRAKSGPRKTTTTKQRIGGSVVSPATTTPTVLDYNKLRK
jgi:hypothetical protein